MSNSSVACVSALLVNLAAGCGASQRLPAVDGGLSPADHPTDATAKRAVDILLMVDNSSEMTAMQKKLVQQPHVPHFAVDENGRTSLGC